MTPPANALPSSWTLRPPIPAVHLLLLLLLMTSLPVSSVEPETCSSRQRQSAIVIVRQALNRTTTAMGARVVRSERDCVLACCSEDVKPGAKCNMAVFNANKHGGEDNCFLFHCQTEQDCPLMKAQDGINTYNIYKGLIHPTTSSTTSLPVVTAKREAAPRTTDKPLPNTETTTTTTPTTTTATAPAPTTTTTTTSTTTTTPATTTTTTSTTTTTPATTTTTTSTTTTTPATTTTTTSTTTTTPATTTTTTPLPATTTTTDLSTTKTTPPASLVIVPKGAVQSDQALQNSSAGRGKSATSSATRGALKSGVLAFMVLGLAVLMLALAVGGRKAMESFDRRHYTRLELNDLHYEV
ncbi:hypothetical protein VZT92_016715 [Zoarces viviparus]|uniref:MANSC domain-containing protein n=1 Tax=Zoarces viviparus TaxID=48416 RepID=A0AAW1EXH3_ZOAVI